jgi:hypothetical protein
MAKTLVECFKKYGKGLNAAEMKAVSDMAKSISEDPGSKGLATEYPNVAAVNAHLDEMESDRNAILKQLGIKAHVAPTPAPEVWLNTPGIDVKEKPIPRPTPKAERPNSASKPVDKTGYTPAEEAAVGKAIERENKPARSSLDWLLEGDELVAQRTDDGVLFTEFVKGEKGGWSLRFRRNGLVETGVVKKTKRAAYKDGQNVIGRLMDRESEAAYEKNYGKQEITPSEKVQDGLKITLDNGDTVTVVKRFTKYSLDGMEETLELKRNDGKEDLLEWSTPDKFVEKYGKYLEAPVKPVKKTPLKPSRLLTTANLFNTPVERFDGYAWRTMSEAELKKLQSGEKDYGGGSAKRGQYLAPTPDSASQYKGKKVRYLVEFAGVEKAEGETVSNVINRDNVTNIKKSEDGGDWSNQDMARFTEYKLTPDEQLSLEAQRKQKKRRKQAASATSFHMWLKYIGGINPNDKTAKGEIRDIFGTKSRKAPIGMFNIKTAPDKKALGIDELTLAAIEDGWLGPNATEDDFIDALMRNPKEKAVIEDIESWVDKKMREEEQRLREEGFSDDEIRKAEKDGIQEADDRVDEDGFFKAEDPTAWEIGERRLREGKIDKPDVEYVVKMGQEKERLSAKYVEPYVMSANSQADDLTYEESLLKEITGFDMIDSVYVIDKDGNESVVVEWDKQQNMFDIPFSKSKGAKPKGLPLSDVQGRVKPWLSYFKGLDVPVFVIPSQNNLGAKKLDKLGIDPTKERNKGLYITGDGIYVFSDEFSNLEQVDYTFFEEVLHRGVEKVIPNSVLTQIYNENKNDKNLQQIIKDYKINKNKPGWKAYTANEFIAKQLKEEILTGKEVLSKGTWQKIITAVRRFLKRIGVKKNIKTEQAKDMVRRAMVEGKTGRMAGAGKYASANKMVAFHGTPHIWTPEKGFPNGRPRLDKIGTGEGAAAYGWGWYSAEKEELAKLYQEQLRPLTEVNNLTVGGIPIYIKGSPVDYSPHQFTNKPTERDYARAKVQEDILINEWELKEAFDNEGVDGVVKIAKRIIAENLEYAKDDNPKSIPSLKFILKRLEDQKNNKVDFKKGESNLYELDIPDSVVPKLLDWDKPLSEQSEHVKKALKDNGLYSEGHMSFEEYKAEYDGIYSNEDFKNMYDAYKKIPQDEIAKTGESLYLGLVKDLDNGKKEIINKLKALVADKKISLTGSSSQKASEYLASIGIPGNTHGGVSQGGTGAKYVIWDQAVLDKVALLKRNQKALKAVQDAQPDEWVRKDMGYSSDDPFNNQERRNEEAGGEEYATHIGKAMSLPDIVWLAKELMKGNYPEVVKSIASRKGKTLGQFSRTKNGRIKIIAELFKNPMEAQRVLAHEIGHLSDWGVEKDMSRGNILGRIASLHKFFKRTLPKKPGESGELSDADRVRLREEARKVLTGERTIDEEITQETPVTPGQILSIWNSVEENISDELLDYVKRLNTAEKKSIIKEAMKGQVPSELQRFANIVKIKTGKKIKIKLTPSEDQIKAKYEDLIREEIKKRKLFTIDEIMDELKVFSRLWSPFDPASDPVYTKYRYSSKELYADAFSAIIVAPGYAETQIPKFTEGFFNYLDRKPKLKEMYDQIQDDIKTGGTLEAIDKRLGDGMKRGSDDWVEQVKKSKRSVFSKELWGNTFLGRDFSILMRVKKARQRSPILHDPFAKSMDPTNAIDDLRYTTTEVNGYIKDMFTKVIKGYEAVGMNDIDFSKYLLFRRIALETGDSKANPEGITKKEANALIKKYDDKFGPKVKEVASSFYSVRKEWILDKLQKNKKYTTPELLKYIEENMDAYATIDIYEHMNKNVGVTSTAGLFAQPIKKRMGSLKSTRPVLSATLENDMAIINAVNKSIAGKSVADFLAEYGEPGDIEPAKVTWDGKKQAIMRPSDPNQGLIVYMDNGKMVGKYVPKYVAEFFQTNPVQAMLMTKMFRWTASPFKAIFTGRNPGFWLFNIIRDYHRAARTLPGKGTHLTFSKYWVRNLKNSVVSSFGKEMSDAERRMMHDKSLLSVMNYHGDESHDAMTERILSRHGLIQPDHNNVVFKAFRKFFHVLDALGMVSERVTKFAADDYLKTNYPDISDKERAYIIRRTGSPSFLTQGTATPLLNNILIFSNPMIQGHREDINFAKQRPIETLFKIGAVVMMPKMLMMAAASGLLGDDWEELYARISEYDKANYICIPFGITPNGKVAYIRFPQDEVSRVIGGTLWKVFSSKKEDYATNLVDYMGGQVPSLSPVWNMMAGVYDYSTGKNIYDNFRQREIFSDQLMSASKVGGEEGKQARDKKRKQFAGWMSNNAGLGIVYKFNSNNVDTVKTELEKVIGYPVLSNIVGRFVKVSDYGKRETLKKAKEKVRSENDLQLFLTSEALKKNLKGEKPTKEETRALFIKYDTLEDKYKNLTQQMYGNVYIQEILNARSTKEKQAVADAAYEDSYSRRLPMGENAKKGIEFVYPKVPWTHLSEEEK